MERVEWGECIGRGGGTGAPSGQILQIFPAWARLWARTLCRAGRCLAAWSAGPGTGDLPRSLESGSLYTGALYTVQATPVLYTSHSIFAFAIY